MIKGLQHLKNLLSSKKEEAGFRIMLTCYDGKEYLFEGNPSKVDVAATVANPKRKYELSLIVPPNIDAVLHSGEEIYHNISEKRIRIGKVFGRRGDTIITTAIIEEGDKEDVYKMEVVAAPKPGSASFEPFISVLFDSKANIAYSGKNYTRF